MSRTTTNTTPATKKVVDAVLSLITVPSGVVKRDTSLEIPVSGKGVLTCEVTDVQQMNPGLPDWRVNVSVMGQTFASEDPGKAIIRATFDAARKAMSTLTPSAATTALNMQNVTVCGVLPVTKASIGESADAFSFTVDFSLVISGVNF